MIIGCILAGGEGSRLKVENTNKTSILFQEKPLVTYGVDLFREVVDKTLVVVGAHADSVKAVINDPEVLYAHQAERLGTGHALQVACAELQESSLTPTMVIVGYGDHMMFYTPEIVKQMIDRHQESHAAITLITTDHVDPDSLAWGRIIRTTAGDVEAVIEQKDATPEQRRIVELNPGFYCFDYAFLLEALPKLQKSPHTGEYYITDLIKHAKDAGRTIVAIKVPFSFVGIGVNTREQLTESQALFAEVNQR